MRGLPSAQCKCRTGRWLDLAHQPGLHARETCWTSGYDRTRWSARSDFSRLAEFFLKARHRNISSVSSVRVRKHFLVKAGSEKPVSRSLEDSYAVSRRKFPRRGPSFSSERVQKQFRTFSRDGFFGGVIRPQMRVFRRNCEVPNANKTNEDRSVRTGQGELTAATYPSCVSRDHEICFGNGMNPWLRQTVHQLCKNPTLSIHSSYL
jgi:hypothetical protein